VKVVVAIVRMGMIRKLIRENKGSRKDRKIKSQRLQR